MKFTLLIALCLTTFTSFTQNNLPYPIIFVHGLAGSDETFGATMEYLSTHDSLGDINVFDVVLNADDDYTNCILLDDVKWQDFTFNGNTINVGRRNYDADINNFVDGWTGSNIFAINFKEERIRGASGSFNDYFDQSNESAIFKQGHALGKMIAEVLAYTNTEKVILVGHSMGGLCIREYLQRTDANSFKTHYINPGDVNGHHVARVATYGTPHTGSNTSFDPTKSDVPNVFGYSEANRDLLWQYNSYTQCTVFPKGIYMFGGNESCIQSIASNATFPNVDINCNGSETDDIIGINENYYSYDYNPNMGLPLDFDYTYMCSIWTNWGSSLIGDGAVSIHRQWLHDLDTPSPIGLADTTMSSIPHTSEGGDYATILRGIDEPEDATKSFEVQFNTKYIGYLTYQMNVQAYDVDYFKIDCSSIDSIEIILKADSLNLQSITFENQDLSFQQTFPLSNSVDTFVIQVPNEIIYLKIEGLAEQNSWGYPYQFTIVPKSFVGLNEVNSSNSFKIFPNPTSGKVNIETMIENFSVEVLSFDGKILYSSQNTNEIDLSFLAKGVYFVKLRTENNQITKRIVKD